MRAHHDLTYGCCAPLLKDAVRLGRRRFGRCGFVVEPCRIAFNGGGMQEWQHRKFPRRSVGHRHERNAAHGHKTTERHAIARSEEHTSELQSLMRISYAVFCLKKKKATKRDPIINNV